MGWTAAEGSRFSGSTPATTRHPAPQAWLPQLACGAFFGAGGRRIDQPAGGNSGACSAPYGFQFTDGRRAWQGRAGNTCSHHRAPRRRPLMGEGGRQAQRHRAPHPHRRHVDAPGRPPGPPGARTRRPSGSVKPPPPAARNFQNTTLRPRTGRLTHDSGVTAEPPPGVPARWPPRRYARSCFRPNQAHSRCPPQHPPRPPHRRREAPAPPFVNP